MTYKETLDFLYTQLPMYQRQGISAFKKDLTNIRKLCDLIGNPQNGFTSIHIAGTNGKGSVTHMIGGVLQGYGKKVGMYTSPHYKDFRERIKINGEYISRAEVIQFVERIRPALDEIPASFFEITVAMAFDHFAREGVDVAVIETGLGGRLDSTNILTPILSVITNIGLDHTDMLGDTLELIAEEKAGIIKNGLPVIIGEMQSEIEHVFRDKAAKENAPITYADELIESVVKEGDHYQVSIIDQETLSLTSPISGPFQHHNIKTALAACIQLSNQGFINLDLKTISNAFTDLKSATSYIGRWEILGEEPQIIADSAHNVAGLKYVVEKLDQLEKDQLHIVLGFAKDKDVKGVLSLFPKDAKYYFAKADIPRGLSSEVLKNIASELGLKGRTYISVKSALSAAKRNANPDDVIYVGGSIFVVAEVL